MLHASALPSSIRIYDKYPICAMTNLLLILSIFNVSSLPLLTDAQTVCNGHPELCVPGFPTLLKSELMWVVAEHLLLPALLC